jgi:hypothetical protein
MVKNVYILFYILNIYKNKCTIFIYHYSQEQFVSFSSHGQFQHKMFKFQIIYINMYLLL